ncbi:hypothetical protein JTE90_019085 [Oedothorax gibbosus]|nr:hypothetical protein JTE90_019085 [Oedothorax gibbosus]
MLGTEQGALLSCNRKFKDPREVVSACYPSSTGPVLAIERNTFFPKLFASCSTWDVKVWSEDLAVSPMFNLLSKDGYVTDVAWSNTNAPFLFVTKTTGCLELWDVLVKNQDPILSFKLESDGLVCVHPKQQCEQIACGTGNGCIHLLEVPKYTSFSNKHEKNLLSSMIDREGKREKLLEGMTREQRARERINKEKNNVSASMESTVMYSVDEVEENENGNIKEFDSNLNSELNDEEVDDTVEEVPFFDLLFVDTLKSILKNEV